MKAIAINGSPRKAGNTAALLNSALKGAASKGADTEMINLYDLSFTGCVSCFACKRKDSKLDGLCAVRDDLTEELKTILDCDCLFLGSPIYLGDVSGEMRSFIERLIFPNLSYDTVHRSLRERKIPAAFFYTMNVDKTQAAAYGYDAVFSRIKNLLSIFSSEPETLISYDTYQFSDYSLYNASKFGEKHKAKIKEERFPIELQKAFDIGARFAVN